MMPVENLIQLQEVCQRRNIKIACAESCTGGMLSEIITSVPGASQIFDRAFITYTNEAKIELLDVSEVFFGTVGAVSEEVATSMAEGALEHSNADISVGITGVAGPDGGTDEKPVGTVYIGCAVSLEKTSCERHVFSGDRTSIRQPACECALKLMLKKLEKLL